MDPRHGTRPGIQKRRRSPARLPEAQGRTRAGTARRAATPPGPKASVREAGEGVRLSRLRSRWRARQCGQDSNTHSERGRPDVVGRARRRGRKMTERKTRGAVPSGHVGVQRASDGKQWEAYVLNRNNEQLLGVYPTIHAAVAARAKYWKERGAAREG